MSSVTRKQRYEQRHPEKVKAYRQSYYQKNRERQKENLKRWIENNPEKWKSDVRARVLKSKYGITPEEYERMFEQQGGVCAVCKRPPGKRRLSVDHDHETGEVRALLCTRCNMALGYADESPSILQGLIDYLKRHL